MLYYTSNKKICNPSRILAVLICGTCYQHIMNKFLVHMSQCQFKLPATEFISDSSPLFFLTMGSRMRIRYCMVPLLNATCLLLWYFRPSQKKMMITNLANILKWHVPRIMCMHYLPSDHLGCLDVSHNFPVMTRARISFLFHHLFVIILHWLTTSFHDSCFCDSIASMSHISDRFWICLSMMELFGTFYFWNIASKVVPSPVLSGSGKSFTLNVVVTVIIGYGGLNVLPHKHYQACF